MENIGDLSSIINKIIADPSFSEMVGRLKGDESEKTSDDIKADMTAKLPDIMAMITPMLGGSDNSWTKDGTYNKSDDAENSTGNGDTKAFSDKHIGSLVQKKYDKAHAEKLLYAIKPYLNKNRCEIIDKCVSVMQITDIVSAFGGLENLLKLGDR